MSAYVLREGMTVRVRSERSARNGALGMLYKLNENRIHDVYFEDSGDILPFSENELFIPLSGGVFAEGESFEKWRDEWNSARFKLLAALASGAFDRLEKESGLDVPDEIVSAIKKIVAVLGSAEAISLFRFLLGR